MPIEDVVERLASDLRPVRRRSASGDALLLALVAAAELAVLYGNGMLRPDMDAAMQRPSFWWKLASLGLIAGLGLGIALAAFRPVSRPRRGLRWLAALVGLSALALALVAWLEPAAPSGLAIRLDWRDGLQCVAKMVTLALPVVAGLGWLMRRGAATDPAAAALAVGVASAAWGAFVFVFACPFDDPLYIGIWYAVGCGLTTLAARLVLPALTRW